MIKGIGEIGYVPSFGMDMVYIAQTFDAASEYLKGKARDTKTETCSRYGIHGTRAL